MGFFKKGQKENNSCCCDNVDSLIIREGSKNETSCCNGSVSANECTDNNPTVVDNNALTIKILGSGCKNCITLTENVKTAVEEMKLEAQIIKVTDFAEITGYGIMSTPAMVVNEKVVSYGKVLKPNEVVKILTKVLGV